MSAIAPAANPDPSSHIVPCGQEIPPGTLSATVNPDLGIVMRARQYLDATETVEHTEPKLETAEDLWRQANARMS